MSRRGVDSSANLLLYFPEARTPQSKKLSLSITCCCLLDMKSIQLQSGTTLGSSGPACGINKRIEGDTELLIAVD